ncbi:SagB/ThcOx family dehydrogenase [Nonomuraea typhae]|uniref:SagB/ThcOx family dehydrogenase n=1 Tax=Nonomuraea typhae TaxID=2603600 RepID=UPI0012F8EDCB|nr:SagB/ThcOx family dehydrogenase [Nonomuraea typhae]
MSEPAPGDLLRRAGALAGRWQGDGFHVENYLSGRSARMSGAVVDLLDMLEQPVGFADLCDKLAHVPGVKSLIGKLVAADIVVVCGGAADVLDRQVATAWVWDPSARHFHFHTSRTRFTEDLAAEDLALKERAKAHPPPSPFLSREGERAELPDAFSGRQGEFWDVLRRRRTHRVFGPGAVELADLATVLGATWGATSVVTDPEVGSHLLKTSPSGGARHPTEVYVVARSIGGLAPGVYHYGPGEHALTLVRQGDHTEEIVEVCGRQPWIGQAAAVFVMTAVMGRSSWKYPQAHAYRVLMMDAGHLGQTFHLVVTALGLAPFTSAAIHTRDAQELLGIDGVTEFPVYTAALGSLPD